jgi:hypothetical protein
LSWIIVSSFSRYIVNILAGEEHLWLSSIVNLINKLDNNSKYCLIKGRIHIKIFFWKYQMFCAYAVTSPLWNLLKLCQENMIVGMPYIFI